MNTEEEERQYQIGYVAGMNYGKRLGKDLGKLAGRHEILSEVVELLSEMSDATYSHHDQNSLADLIYDELKDKDDED